VASDAAFNIKDYLTKSSPMALLTVRDCEKELDRIEQEVDQQLPAAIAQVSELEARELLACLRFSAELERIGDLLYGVGQRFHNSGVKLHKNDLEQLVAMITVLEKMLEQVRLGFVDRNIEVVDVVLRADREIDQLYRALFSRHLHGAQPRRPRNAELLFMAQAIERAGDHATNMAEELFRLMEGRSLRHSPKKEFRD
jgi:phosphate transport system protein